MKEFEIIKRYIQRGESDMYDVTEVGKLVRCKDCKRYTPFRNIQGREMGEGECEGYDPCVPANHFCSRGERKGSEE